LCLKALLSSSFCLKQDILQKSEQQPESGTNLTGSSATLKGGKVSPVWAHQAIPEKGCLLIATEEIDRDDNFQRSVILLISLGSRYPHEGHGPVGLILNHPLDQKVKEIETIHPGLQSNFGDHQLHFGGPLQSSDVGMFLVKTGGGVIGIAHESGLQQVVSGVHFGGAKRIEEAAALVRGGVLEPSDFKFFTGYACWGYDQLMHEIEMGYWVVAACSSNVIGRAITGTSDQMWQEVLEIMGGQYADLSKKARLDEPKQD
jgi:putative AlgH/UPF0301 family transcriptional regulator